MHYCELYSMEQTISTCTFPVHWSGTVKRESVSDGAGRCQSLQISLICEIETCRSIQCDTSVNLKSSFWKKYLDRMSGEA